jgi:hypothetical protein
MSQVKPITLDNLISALKALYGQSTEVPLLILRHWAARDYDMAQATPELIREIEEGYLGMYHATTPLERSDALDLLRVYGEHFYETASSKERAAVAIAVGYSPIEYEIINEGFSLRELMQALKTLGAHNGPAPEDMLIAFFERYICEFHVGQEQLIAEMPQIIARYRREVAMESEERARAILKAFGVRLLDMGKAEDVQKLKELSGAKEH